MIALFYEKGAFGTDYILRIGDAEAIRKQLANHNDWLCLVNSGRAMGPKRDQPKLDALLHFLRSCAERETLEKFKIKISTGELACVMCAENELELEKMRKFILSAAEIKQENHEKLNGLFDRLESYMENEDDSVLYSMIATRQYITSGIGRDDYLN